MEYDPHTQLVRVLYPVALPVSRHAGEKYLSLELSFLISLFSIPCVSLYASRFSTTHPFWNITVKLADRNQGIIAAFSTNESSRLMSENEQYMRQGGVILRPHWFLYEALYQIYVQQNRV